MSVPPPRFDATLPVGIVRVPPRPIGSVSPEEPVDYPTAWPAYVKAAMDRRGAAPLVLYCDGIWDVFHYGHARALEQAKKSFPHAILKVGVCSDALTHKYKGQTVMTDLERYESLRHCKWVDEVIADAPWVITDEFLEKHDIDFVCHDALPYVDTSGQSATGDVYAHLKEMGKFHETQRTEGVSTSDLIVRIVKRYDDFVRRNLARGYSAEEMNVPLYKETALRIEMAIEKRTREAKDKVKQITDAGNAQYKEFLALFGSRGPVGSRLLAATQRMPILSAAATTVVNAADQGSSQRSPASVETSPTAGAGAAAADALHERDVEAGEEGEEGDAAATTTAPPAKRARK